MQFGIRELLALAAFVALSIALPLVGALLTYGTTVICVLALFFGSGGVRKNRLAFHSLIVAGSLTAIAFVAILGVQVGGHGFGLNGGTLLFVHQLAPGSGGITLDLRSYLEYEASYLRSLSAVINSIRGTPACQFRDSTQVWLVQAPVWWIVAVFAVLPTVVTWRTRQHAGAARQGLPNSH